MALLIAFALMIVDTTMTLVVHQDVGELNPIFARLLAYDETRFIYAKIAVSISLAMGLLILNNVRPLIGKALTILAVFTYLGVAYIHLEVYRSVNHQPPFLMPLVDTAEKWIESLPPGVTQQSE